MAERKTAQISGGLQARLEALEEVVLKQQARWALSLAIGNGAGLAALGVRLLDAKEDPEKFLLFPSICLFAAGLLAAGLIGLNDLKRSVRSLRKAEADLAGEFESANTSDVVRARGPRPTDYGADWRMELLSAALFAAGILWPLVVVGRRLFMAGVFS